MDTYGSGPGCSSVLPQRDLLNVPPSPLHSTPPWHASAFGPLDDGAGDGEDPAVRNAHDIIFTCVSDSEVSRDLALGDSGGAV